MPNGSSTAKAIDYSLKRWMALAHYIDDGQVPIDNNWIENRIRPIATGRKNWLFAGSLPAGKRAAAIMSLIQPAKLNGHAPFLYLKDFAGMAKGVFLNRVPSIVSAMPRKLDDYGLLGKNLMVIGTNAMYGYESVAGVQFDAGLMATTDVNLVWDARATLKLALLDDAVVEAGVLAILQKVDRSFEPVRKGDFRAVNKAGFYVDLVKQAPNRPRKAGEPEQIAAEDLKLS